MMFMSACVVTTQFTITLLAAWAGRTAGSWGRKPLLLIGFGVLPIRSVLYTLTNRISLCWSASRCSTVSVLAFLVYFPSW